MAGRHPDRTDAPPSGDVPRLAEHLFRHEGGKLVSILTAIFGFNRLQLAEDVVQEALARALQTWPYYGIPSNPAAWLTQTAKNLALDVVRRERLFYEKQPQIVAWMEQWGGEAASGDSAAFETEIQDGRLRLMFACCHPLLPLEARTALALRTLCGFSPAEIASAFLTTEAAINKRLTRAKQKIRDARIPFEIPAGNELSPRLDGVLQTLYLLFNEGYKASSGDTLVREELCHEAIRLTELLSAHPLCNQPRVHALAALMLLNGARLPERVDSDGYILRLKEQDRSRWDRAMIQRGILHLGKSAAGHKLDPYHFQAGIAACHCLASDYKSTDWHRILALYDQWVQIDPSPVIALNRAVAVANVSGPRAAIDAINSIPNRNKLDAYHLLHAVLGEFHAELREFATAAGHFRNALQFVEVPSEKSLLSKRLIKCETAATPNRKPID